MRRVLAVLLLAAARAGYAPTSLLALRVGDGLYCPSANASCSLAAPLFLDEFSLLTGARVSSTAVTGATLSATDQYVGALSRSADGASLAFGANAALAGMAPIVIAGAAGLRHGGVPMTFAGDRVIGRVNASGFLDTSTRFASVDYANGSVHAACSIDGTGFWVAGNATTSCISYVAFGSGAGSGNLVNVAHDANCNFGGVVKQSLYTGCTAMASPNQLYFTRSALGGNADVHVDVPSPRSQSPLWTTAGSLALSSTTAALTIGSSLNWYFGQFVTNRAQSQFWVTEPFSCGILYSNDVVALPSLPQGSVGYLVGGSQAGVLCAVSGLALSPDESVLYFSAGTTIFWVPSTPALNGITLSSTAASPLQPNVLVSLALPFFEFRGIALAPQTCSSPGYYCIGGALPALPCTAGYFCIGGGAQQQPCSAGVFCTAVASSNFAPCPAGWACPGGGQPAQACQAGTYSAGGAAATSCVPCSAGVLCRASATNNSVVCPAGWACPSGGAATACIAGTFALAGASSCTSCSSGIYCNASSSSNSVPCPAGLACSGLGAAPVVCGAGTFSAASAALCATCPRNAYSFSSSSSCLCLPGFASNGLLGAALVCSACLSLTYSLGGATSCSPCPPSATFSSSSQGCVPLLASGVGAQGVGFAFSGSSAEGFASFARVVGPAGLTYAPNSFGAPSSALSLSTGSYISAAPLASAPTVLPAGNAPFTASAWVKCNLPSGGQATVLEWGVPGPVGAVSKLSLMVGPASVNGSKAPDFASTGGQASVLAGSGVPGEADNVALSATLMYPWSIAVDPATGDVWFGESRGNIRVLNATTGAVQTLINGRYAVTVPGLTYAFSIVFSGTTVFLSVSDTPLVYSFPRATGNLSVFAGGGASGTAIGSSDGIGTSALFQDTFGLLIDSSDQYLYLCDGYNAKIRRIEAATGIVTSFIGGGASGIESGLVDGVGSSALFVNPWVAVLDSRGNMWIADGFDTSVVRKVVMATLTVTTVAGTIGVTGTSDGVGSNALFSVIYGIVVDPSSSFLCVADSRSNSIRKIDTATGTVTTLASGPPFNYPWGIALDASGSVLVANLFGSNLVKVVQAPLVPACDQSWHHIALTQGDGTPTTRKTYLDGALVSTVTGQTYNIPTTGTASAPLTLRVGWSGDLASNGGDLFSGLLSDLRIYGRALPAAEILTLLAPPTLVFPPAASKEATSSTTVIAAVVAVLAVLAVAEAVRHYVVRRHQRKVLRAMKADAEAAPSFAIDFVAGELTTAVANPLPAAKLAAAAAAVAGGAASVSASSAAVGQPQQCLSELLWSDLVPDPRYPPMFGGFGVVLVARWKSKRRLVAVKVPKAAVLSREQSREAVQMLLAEAQGLVHASDGGINEHVVQVFGVAQGKAEGWQTALRLSRAADSKRQAKKAATTASRARTSRARGTTTTAAAAASDPTNEGGAGADESESASEGEAEITAGAAPAEQDADALADAGRPAPFLFGLVMSFESGGSLQRKLHPRRGGRVAWPSNLVDRLRVLKEAAAGLYGLHATGMVHGDLKPDNVLLGSKAETLHVRLADFGLSTIRSAAERASRVSTLTTTDEKRGTWPFMAPEMYRSKEALAAAASRSTDVYAFGTLAWEVLSGQVPWRDYTEQDRLASLLRGDGLDLSSLARDTPPGVVALVARCLSSDRALRPRMAEVLSVFEQAHENVVSGRFDVFLSYAWGAKAARKPLADEVYLALRAAGVRVWMDELEMSHDLQASMSEGIAKSEAVVVLVSPAYAASKPCMFELRAAVAAGKPLVTCCVEPGFWKSWGLAPDGSGTRAVPDDHEVVALARLETHLFVDLGAASAVDWRSESLAPSERGKLTLPEALPRLLALLKAARKAEALGAAAY